MHQFQQLCCITVTELLHGAFMLAYGLKLSFVLGICFLKCIA